MLAAIVIVAGAIALLRAFDALTLKPLWNSGLTITSMARARLAAGAGQVYLVTDGGLNHHLSASGNFGQVVRKNYPVTICPQGGDKAGAAERIEGYRPITLLNVDYRLLARALASDRSMRLTM